MGLAVAEGDRQGHVVGQTLPAQLLEDREGEVDLRQVEALADRARPLEQHPDRAALIELGLLDAVLGAKHPDLLGAALPVERDAVQLRMQGAEMERGARERQAELEHALAQPGEQRRAVGQLARRADQPVEQRPGPPGPVLRAGSAAGSRHQRPPDGAARSSSLSRARAAVSAWVV